MSELADALANLEEDKVRQLVQQRVNSNADAMSVVEELRKGMDIVGERYKSKEYFLSELIISGEMFKESMAVIEPRLKAGKKGEPLGRMVLGTVKGDIHNIGKDIVATLLTAAGFEVYDLGIDVPPEKFVEKLSQTDSTILGMSGLLTPAFESMKETVKAVEAAGLRDKVKVIIGGGIVTEQVGRYVGADAFTDDASEGVDMCRLFVKGN
ncbi:MAG: cobalamin-binding protein [Chloroflexi bacterium]|nr:cobalamin-binding protein [Chloroflexota bacterium]MBM3172254.1 cobalamin-binding protein [Chloroflexota bacterium]MBM3174646.1 cobalamin-binding protein [Chloroflexota bacterium]MBM4450013.1 cobalamin-binding protein [Chloroflexota bacterium]